MDDQKVFFNLTITSTRETLVTALLPYLQHKYKHGNSKEAISILSDLFNGLVARVGIENILSNAKQPLFDFKDIKENKLTFSFSTYELAEDALEKLDQN